QFAQIRIPVGQDAPRVLTVKPCGCESIGPSDSGGQMGQGAYSNDLRSRVVAEVAAGTSRRQAARLYRVSASSAVRWAELHDETGTNTKRVRNRGRCLRGRQQMGKSQWGHWQATTFVADQRCNKISAPCVQDGAMHGQGFLTYDETNLVTGLSEGDIEVMDN